MKSSARILLAICALLGTVQGTQWPSWRGPNQDGTTPDTGFPVKWDKSTNLRWRTELPEPGNSSPIVWNGTVFITQALDDGKERTVMAFDRKSGRLLWQRGVRHDAKDPRHQTNPHCAASPVTDGQCVVAGFASAGVVAYDFSGKELWKADLGKQVHGWGQGSSPVLHGDQVIVYQGPGEFSTLVALDKRTGALLWQVPLKEQHPPERWDGFAGKNDGMIGTFSTPLVVRAGGRDEIVLPVVNQLKAFDSRTGSVLWFADGINPLVYSSPTLGQGTLVVFGGFFGSGMFIRPGGAGDRTGERLFYERRLKKHTIGSPIVKDGHIYQSSTDGFGQCFELSTGKLVWEERLPSTGASGQTWSSMVRSGDLLYVVNQSGDTLVLKASPKYELVSTNPIGEVSNSTLALSEGEVFLRTQSALYCIAKAGSH